MSRIRGGRRKQQQARAGPPDRSLNRTRAWPRSRSCATGWACAGAACAGRPCCYQSNGRRADPYSRLCPPAPQRPDARVHNAGGDVTACSCAHSAAMGRNRQKVQVLIRTGVFPGQHDACGADVLRSKSPPTIHQEIYAMLCNTGGQGMRSSAAAWRGRTTVKSRRLRVASVVSLSRSATATSDASMRSSRSLAYCSTSCALRDGLELAAGDQAEEGGLGGGAEPVQDQPGSLGDHRDRRGQLAPVAADHVGTLAMPVRAPVGGSQPDVGIDKQHLGRLSRPAQIGWRPRRAAGECHGLPIQRRPSPRRR